MGMDPVRYLRTTLIDDGTELHRGDVLLHDDGRWSHSNGDEDVLEEIDGRHRLVTRSLQNWHTHLAMQLNARDFSDGFPLDRWLNEAIFPTELRLDPRTVSIGVRAAASELIRTGTTFAADMYFFPEAIGPVLEEAGLRGIVAGPVTPWPPSDEGDDGTTLAHLERLLGEGPIGDGRVQYGVASHAVYTCDEETLHRGKDLATRHDAHQMIHISETRKEVADCHATHGVYPVEYLDSIDFLGPRTICAHAGWVKKNEIGILAEREATVVHCPTSNMKLGTGGTLSYPVHKAAGVDVRLGTDGPASSGSGFDLRMEARVATLVQRHDHWDPTLLPAQEAWQMATKGSQDWVTWNLDDIRMRPLGRSGNRHLAHLIHNSSECLDVWVDGQALRRDGVTSSVDERSAWGALDSAVESYYEGLE